MMERARSGAFRVLAILLLGVLLGRQGALAAPPVSPWADYFPNVPLVTQEGKTVRFYDDLIKDKVVVVSFVYTRCGFACPLIVANLARVQELLGNRVGRDIHLYSISIDPEHDTPRVLRKYAEAFDPGPGWTFLTGKPEDIALLRARFGDRFPVEDHAPQVAIGSDATGSWIMHSAVGDPEYLARAITRWVESDRREPGGRGSGAPSSGKAPGTRGFR